MTKKAANKRKGAPRGAQAPSSAPEAAPSGEELEGELGDDALVTSLQQQLFEMGAETRRIKLES